MFDFYNNPESFKEANGYVIEGVWYPRVTKIVSIKAKPALYRFYGEAANFKAGLTITQQSAKEGTLIHEIVEAFLLGKNPDIDSSVAPAIDAFLKFWNGLAIEVTPEVVERRIISKNHRYAGTVDAIAKIGGKLGVLDIKTSLAIYRDYNLQTAAYVGALQDEFPDLQTRWILRIDQIQKCTRCGATRRLKGDREKIRGEYNNPLACAPGTHLWSELQGDIEFKEFPKWQSDFEAFLGAKKLWEWENEDWLRQVGYL